MEQSRLEKYETMSGLNGNSHVVNRRSFLLSTGGVVAFAGCLEDSENIPAEPGTDDDTSTESENQTQESDPVAQIESFSATSLESGDRGQRITLLLAQVDPGEEFDVYLDVTSLTEANVDVTNLGVTADVTYDGRGWVVTDAEISDDDRIVIRVRISVTEEESINERATVEINLIDLDTDEGVQASDLQHYAALTTSEHEGEPNFERGEKSSYNVVNPDELENVLGGRAYDIRIGETEQEITLRVSDATEEISIGIDITSLADAGVEFEDAEVVIDEAIGERRDGIGEVEITSTSFEDGVINLQITTDSTNLGIDLKITNLVTDNAEPRDDLTYPLFTGESPSDGEESMSFRIAGAAA